MADYITTYTGDHFDPTLPKAEHLHIEDIAHALSLICRGNGHVKTFFSVGSHCINCAKEAAAVLFLTNSRIDSIHKLVTNILKCRPAFI